jgi:TetR/AcrR family transcriptional regulator, transcriptional repressor for nem operon
MGRPKTYDRDEITERAMRLFWERGFHGTSTRDLTEAMGVNPYSLYAEFGSKEALYSAGVERYERDVVTRNFGRLEGPGATLDDVRQVLGFFGDAGQRAASARGCLMCNAGVERAPSVEASQASTARFVRRLTAAFENALRNAAAAGCLAPGSPIEALAAGFVTHLMGVFVLMRARADAATLRAAADDALARLDAVTVRPRSAARRADP